MSLDSTNGKAMAKIGKFIEQRKEPLSRSGRSDRTSGRTGQPSRDQTRVGACWAPTPLCLPMAATPLGKLQWSATERANPVTMAGTILCRTVFPRSADRQHFESGRSGRAVGIPRGTPARHAPSWRKREGRRSRPERAWASPRVLPDGERAQALPVRANKGAGDMTQHYAPVRNAVL